MLGQCVCEALSTGAVVSVCGQHPVHPTVHLQRSHTQRRAAQLIHQHVAADMTRGKMLKILVSIDNLDTLNTSIKY